MFKNIVAEINWEIIFIYNFAWVMLRAYYCVYFCGSEVVTCSQDGTTLLGTSGHSPSLKIASGTDSSLTPSLTHPCTDGENVRKEEKKGVWGPTYANIPPVSACGHHVICCYGKLMLASCSCGLIRMTVKSFRFVILQTI